MKIKTTNYTSIRMGNSVFKVRAPNAGAGEEKSDFSHRNIKNGIGTMENNLIVS